MTQIDRRPPGTPAGGQFAATARSKSIANIDLDGPTEDDLAGIEPDQDDYEIASEDAVRMSGLESMQSGDVYWNQETADFYPKDGLGFDASGSFEDVDEEYLTEALSARVTAIASSDPERRLHIKPYARGNDSWAAERNQFISVSLTDAERADVAAQMTEDGEEFVEEQIGGWEQGAPAYLDDTFGGGTRVMWDNVSAAVRKTSPAATEALDTAAALREDACGGFQSDCHHIGTDEWRRDQWDARNGR